MVITTKWTNDIMSKTRPPASSLEKALTRNRNATKFIVCSLPLATNALLPPTRNTRQLPFHELSFHELSLFVVGDDMFGQGWYRTEEVKVITGGRMRNGCVCTCAFKLCAVSMAGWKDRRVEEWQDGRMEVRV